jgi:hypothetical protein
MCILCMGRGLGNYIRTKNDPVAVARLLHKYKGLDFLDTDSKETFSICEENMEFCRGNGNAWFVIAVCAKEEVEDVLFMLELASELIGDT